MPKMKVVWGSLWIVACVALTVSCSGTLTYTDMLEREQKAIDALFVRRGFEVIQNYPKDGQFGEGEFYRMENGVYVHVIDTGGERALTGDIIVARYAVNYFSLDSTLYPVLSNYGPHSSGTMPVNFYYGNYSMTIPNAGGTNALQATLEAMMSEGLQSGLEYVGHCGKVRLIVPFKVGCSSDMSSGTPVFFETVEYRLERLL
ncbi:MAG: DUF4827 domain-containing protein [Tannerellaceae bacterium]|jgi:hypothetical protein|nr:DUF4827 domain-containing protein [Tannerellaceae bacterium]